MKTTQARITRSS